MRLAPVRLRLLPMPAAPKPLKAKPPAKRDPRVPEVLWRLPMLLQALSEAKGFFQKDVARAGGVTQSAVSRWLDYKGLSELAAAKLIRLEEGLALPPGTLLPRAPAEDVELLRRHATEIGLVPSIWGSLSDDALRARMRQLSRPLRQAILGFSHVFDLPLEASAAIAEKVWVKTKPVLRDAMTASEWYEKMRDEPKPAVATGTFPLPGKIPIPSSRP